MITDTHAHLYYPELLSEIDQVLYRAEAAGISRIIVPAVDLESSRQILDLSEKNEMIFAAVGVHPCDVSKNEITVIEEIEKLAESGKVAAIGETGLDYYWDTSGIEKQKIFFKRQIELAKRHKLPIVIHTRNSIDDAIEIVEQEADENLSGQFHCFSGDKEHLQRILNLRNFYVSYCGNITYKNFKNQEVILETPPDRLLSETDSPFLPPVPHRGKTNEPSYVTFTLKKIAEIRQTNYEELLEAINKNVRTLFKKLHGDK